jgi:uncharacterized membrane protein YfcA
MVQLASNASRSLFGLRDVDWKIVAQFIVGALVGSALGSRFVLAISGELLFVLLGSFVLLMIWAPALKDRLNLPGRFFSLGIFQGILTLFVGATGPLNSPFLLREGLSRDRLVVTHGALMTALHLIKVLTFGLLGFVFSPYAPLIIGMIVSVSLGSYVGTRIRSKVSEETFLKLFKAAVTLLALRMILKGLL